MRRLKSILIFFSAAILAAGCSDPIGSAGAVITLDPRAPLTVGLTLDGDEIVPASAEVTIRAEVVGGSPPYTYSWYLDGVFLESNTGSTVNLGPGLGARSYRVGLVVADGETLGSAELTFEVLE